MNLWDVPGCKDFVTQAHHTEDYRFNAKKFARKAYAQIHALSQPGQIVLWFDADVEFKAPLGAEHIARMIGPYLSYMGRKDHCSCSSFVAWDVRHPDHARFMEVYRELYDGRELYAEKEWHDAYILDVAIRRSKCEALDLCRQISKAQGSANVFDMVFPQGHHKKGARKIGIKGG